MGITQVTNEEGRTNMSFRGGSDQSTETGSDEEKWGIRFDLGAKGDVFNFELTTPLGQVLFRIHVDADGACEDRWYQWRVCQLRFSVRRC